MRSIATIAICAFLPVSLSGCFGRFNLVRKTYDFNKSVSPDKWVQWFVFLVLSIIPIYALAGLIDVIVANSVEFWTGTNPVTAESTRTFHGDDGEVAVVTYRTDGIMDVHVTLADGNEQFVRLMREQHSIVAVDADGAFLARVGDADGQPALIQ
jgi:hypothetical protein